MTAIQVKCYLFPDNVNVEFAAIPKANEIRRFNLATEGSKGIYDQLVDKIAQSFGDLLPSREAIRTYWQDDENELVGFSSDTELQYAIDLQTAIRLSKPYDRHPSQSVGPSSLFKVYVARKKTCEAGKDSGEKEPLHFGVVCDACNGSIVGIRYKCAICPDYDLCSGCKSKGAHRDTEHAFNAIEKPNFWKPLQYRRNGGGRCPYRSQCRSQQQQPSADSAASAGFQNPLGNLFAPFMSGANIPIVNDPEQLKNIGESLKKFLDPFGIDVDYYVDSFNRAARSNENKPAEKKEAEAATENKEQEKKAAEEAPKQPEPAQMEVEKDEAPAAATATASTTQDADLIKLSGSSPFAAASEALSNFLVKQSESQTVQPNAPVEEPAVIPKYPQAKENQPMESIEESFNLIDIEKELKIIKAIEQLKSMGYADDGGWLTRLATAKDGNINAVLDAISPSLPHRN